MNGNNNTLSRKMYDFCVEKKRKNAFSITVQPTSIARRWDGEMFHSLPTSSRRQGRQPHNLSAAVEANRPNAKKH